MGLITMAQAQELFIKRPEVAELTRKIVAVLIGVNDEMSDATISQIIGETVGPSSYALRAAFRDLQRADPPIHFRRIRRVGWKRMHDTDLVAHSEVDLKKIARGARRGRKRLGDVRFAELSNRDQLHAARNNTRFAAIEDAAASVKSRLPSTIPDLSDVIAKIKGEQA
jgi:hypothetical protein